MDMVKFTAALEVLMREHGMELSATPEISLSRPRMESFIGNDMSVDAFQATRERQPFDLRITAKASVIGAWHHKSGDDRRLHPDLRSTNGVTYGTLMLNTWLGMTIAEDAGDALRYRRLLQYLIGPRTDLDDAIVTAKTKGEYDAILDSGMMATDCIYNAGSNGPSGVAAKVRVD